MLNASHELDRLVGRSGEADDHVGAARLDRVGEADPVGKALLRPLLLEHDLDAGLGERARREVDHLVGAGDLALLAGQPGDRGVGVEIVGIDDRRLLRHLIGLHQILHQPRVGFAEVLGGVGLEIEDVLVAALVDLQRHAGRDRVEHLVLLGDRGLREGDAAGERAEQHAHLVLVDQALDLRLAGLVGRLVVADDDARRLAEQAAVLVQEVDAELVGLLVLLAVDGEAAGQRQRRSEHHLGGREMGRSGQQSGNQGEHADKSFHV